MINTTPDTILFSATGKELSDAIRSSLERTSQLTLEIFGLTEIDLGRVTTKTYSKGTYAKFVQRRVLTDNNRVFDEAYVNNAWLASRTKGTHVPKELFINLMNASSFGEYEYKQSFAGEIHTGLGLFLISLHCDAVITLPATFNWPRSRLDSDGERLEVSNALLTELFVFIRSLDTQSDKLPHPAFGVVSETRKRKERFLTYGTKMLLATGWRVPEDAKLEDLLQIKAAQEEISSQHESRIPLVYEQFIEVLRLGFPGRFNIDPSEWSGALRDRLTRLGPRARRVVDPGDAVQRLIGDGPRDDQDLIAEMLTISADVGDIKNVEAMKGLPNIDFDVKTNSINWLNLEKLYIKKTQRENYKAVFTAFKWWNIYLFFYLPYWFSRHRETKFVYPSQPSLLLKTVFVSRLLDSEVEAPATFVDFIEAQAQIRWADSTYYAYLKQLEKFFDFIKDNAEDLQGCEGFKQPLSEFDFPDTQRSKGTNKKPIPRKLFGLFTEYHEALISYSEAVLEQVLAGRLKISSVRGLNGSVIDTHAMFKHVGFIPKLMVRDVEVPLQFIPNVLCLRRRHVTGIGSAVIPHPHALHQNLVALHTGIRHNHLQWLDFNTFDSRVAEDDVDFTSLLVNTDKSMLRPWTPHVSMRVIEILRSQKRWSELIDEEGFRSDHYYNDNPRTKWARLRPLFAYSFDGKPHGDSVYSNVWQDTLCGFQGLLPILTEERKSYDLVSLLPPGMAPTDPELKSQLEAYGKKFGLGQNCPLRVFTLSTPHSSRSAVVSQYITFLPADLIGKYITGQKSGTVTYYSVIDLDDIETERAHQALRTRAQSLKEAYRPIVSGYSNSFIRADAHNSEFMKAFRLNACEAVKIYGGMSITFTETDRDGIDVISETAGHNAAFNKTEICPHGNNCPPAIVKQIRGFRRCSICPAAVRTVDHLPAVLAKKRQTAELADDVDKILRMDGKFLKSKYTEEELADFEDQLGRLCEDLSGWILTEEVLEVARRRLTQTPVAQGVGQPEIIQHGMERVSVPVSETEYVFARLGECLSFPSLESPQIRARFDLLRRELMVRAGNLKDAFSSLIPVDPASECAGLLRSVISSTGLSVDQVVDLLENNTHLLDLPRTQLKLLDPEDPRFIEGIGSTSLEEK